MPKPVIAVKHGDLQSGNWTWALGAESSIGSRPLIIATFNFHGAVAAGYDSEELAARIVRLLEADNDQR